MTSQREIHLKLAIYVVFAIALVVITRNEVDAQTQEFRKCAKNLCQNNGVCWLTDSDYVVCSCPYPYYGSLCQLTRNQTLPGVNNNINSVKRLPRLILKRD